MSEQIIKLKSSCHVPICGYQQHWGQYVASAQGSQPVPCSSQSPRQAAGLAKGHEMHLQSS